MLLAAAGWGALGASTLLLGMVAGFVWSPSKRLLGLILAFGAGALFSAIAFELADDAIAHGGEHLLAVGMAVGALVYVGGSRLLPGSRDDGDDSRAIVLGATLDGVPESLAIGAGLAGGGSVSVVLLAAVALSNVPEALGATVGMRSGGSPTSRLAIAATWGSLVAVSAVAAGIGYLVLDAVPEEVGAAFDAFAAGGILAMLTDTMIPDAYRDAGRIAGLASVVGFAVAFLIG